MSRKTIIEQLKALASDDTKRSKAARLRDVIDEVEATLAAGITRAEVVKMLAENGLEMSLATFNSELQKVRNKRGKALVSQVMSNHQSIAKTARSDNTQSVVKTDGNESNDDSEITAGYGSHDPRSIDAIMRSTPDLEYYEKIAKNNRRNKNS